MFFSVIVPVYNVESYLKECIDSVLGQTFQDFELILIDDGSNDNSGKICDEYAEKNVKVRALHKSNGGQSTARNAGIREAKGKFAIFLDSDDYICDNHFFSEIYDVINEKTDVVVYRYNKLFGEVEDDCGISMKGIDGKEKNAILAELVRKDAFFCSCWSKAVRLELIKKNNVVFDEELKCEDMDWYYTVVQIANNFRVIDRAYINYRQHERSVTARISEKTIRDFIYTIEKWSEEFRKIKDVSKRTVMFSSLAKLYSNLIISYSRHSKELKHLKKSIFSFKYLLEYDLNPRVKKIAFISRGVGLNMTSFLLGLYDKLR